MIGWRGQALAVDVVDKVEGVSVSHGHALSGSSGVWRGDPASAPDRRLFSMGIPGRLLRIAGIWGVEVSRPGDSKLNHNHYPVDQLLMVLVFITSNSQQSLPVTPTTIE